MVTFFRQFAPPVFVDFCRRLSTPAPSSTAGPPFSGIPDASLYRPYFSPWEGFGEFSAYFDLAKEFTLIPAERLYIIYSLAQQAIGLNGAWFECGVYKGGSAMLLAKILVEKHKGASRCLHLFDTFEGMPPTDPVKDLHKEKDFQDTSLEAVELRIRSIAPNVDFVSFYKGFIPDTFTGLESQQISLAHIDVDIYRSVMDCCTFIYPRLVRGGFMIFDDYGEPSCPGARKAVDEFFADKPEMPLVLHGGHALVFRSI
jgi:O-methyltransferase